MASTSISLKETVPAGDDSPGIGSPAQRASAEVSGPWILLLRSGVAELVQTVDGTLDRGYFLPGQALPAGFT